MKINLIANIHNLTKKEKSRLIYLVFKKEFKISKNGIVYPEELMDMELSQEPKNSWGEWPILTWDAENTLELESKVSGLLLGELKENLNGLFENLKTCNQENSFIKLLFKITKDYKAFCDVWDKTK